MSAATIAELPAGDTSGADLLPAGDNPVCAGPNEDEAHFFYFYRDLITKIGIRFPFTPFQISVLHRLRVAPSQLHPNSWAFVRGFEQACSYLNLPCTCRLFFFFFRVYTSRSGSEAKGRKSWVVCRGTPHQGLFIPYTQSFKNFKTHFFKVAAQLNQVPWFGSHFREDGELFTKFDLYWTKNHYNRTPKQYSVRESRLDEEELVGLRVLKAYVDDFGHFDLSQMVNSVGDELKQILVAIADYKKFLKKNIKLKSPAPVTNEDPSKRRKLDLAQVTNSSTLENEDEVTILPSPPRSATPHFSETVYLEPGSLWKTGVSPRLREVIKPLLDPFDTSPFPSHFVDELNNMEATCLKAASLMPYLQSLHRNYESSYSSMSVLNENFNKLKEEHKKLSEEHTSLQTKHTTDSNLLKEQLAKAEADLKAANTSAEQSLAEKDRQMSKLQDDYDEAASMVSVAAIQAFANAISQARALNPDLNTDGMDVSYSVKDGCIVPGTPDGGEGDYVDEPENNP